MVKHVLLALLLTTNTALFSQSEAKFYTTKGDFVVYLEDTLAPITAGNFIKLVNQKYYDGVIIHRVVPNFVIQGGDATLTGGNRAQVIQDEFHDSLSNVKGTISMANAGPNTGTSQFFINLKDNKGLDYNKAPLASKHPVFGHVIEGYSTVEAIAQVALTGSRPTVDVVMDSVRILPKKAPDPKPSNVAELHELKIGWLPNPAKNKIWITDKSLTTVDVKIIDLTGAVILNQESYSPEDAIDVSHLPEGVYFIKSKYREQVSIQQITVRR